MGDELLVVPDFEVGIVQRRAVRVGDGGSEGVPNDPGEVRRADDVDVVFEAGAVRLPDEVDQVASGQWNCEDVRVGIRDLTDVRAEIVGPQ